METIGLIAAMPQESEALLRYVEKWERAAPRTFRGAHFQLGNRNCLLITTGMGLKRAMDGTRALLAATRPHLLISFGIAGAVEDDLQIGDMVAAEKTCLLDKGVPGKPWLLATLSEKAWDAATRALPPHGARLVAGTALTTRGSQVVLQSSEKIIHPVLEMETAGIAQIAAEAGIPLVSIRSISDGPQSPIPFDLEAVLDENDNLRLGKLLMVALRNPRLIAQSRQMIRNSGKAADHAAKVVTVLLNQPSSVAALK